jgi:cytochrome c biogenesis protein CcmG, thiol:disulfide interchange protein DsbE
MTQDSSHSPGRNASGRASLQAAAPDPRPRALPDPARRKAVVGGLGMVLAGAVSATPPQPGALAPDIALPDATVPGLARLSDLRGRVVYLDFWASWCAPCRLSFPWMNDLQARHQARRLQVLGVNLDAQRVDAQAFLQQVPARFPVAFDPAGAGARAFGVRAMPTSVLIGMDGRIVAVHRGFHPDQRDRLEASILAALPPA